MRSVSLRIQVVCLGYLIANDINFSHAYQKTAALGASTLDIEKIVSSTADAQTFSFLFLDIWEPTTKKEKRVLFRIERAFLVAGRAGFEPATGFTQHSLSRRAHSATLAPPHFFVVATFIFDWSHKDSC